MTQQKKSDAGFLLQGSILAIASIISRVVGLIYRIPLTAIIGKQGNDFYGTAYEVYNIILLISCYSIPLSVSKLISAKMAMGHAKEAMKVLRGSLIFAVISGGIFSSIVYIFADFFTGTLLKTPLSVIALKILAPTIFIVAVLGVFRGFFQGLHTMIPSAISQLFEQIVNAVISVVAAYNLYNYGRTVGAVLANEDLYAAAYGAAGGTLGTATGAFFALLFVLFIYAIYRKKFISKIKRDLNRDEDTFFTIARALFLTIIPIILSTTIYNISGILDQGIFKNIVNLQGYSSTEISSWWGVFAGQYKVLINVPISIASAIGASVVPSLTAAYHRSEFDSVKHQINLATRFISIISFPCAAGLFVLSGPVMQLLFNDSDPTSSYMLMLGAISIVFYSLSTLSNGILQGIDRMKVPVMNAFFTLILHLGFLMIILEVFDLNIYAVILANIFYSLCMVILNGIALKRYANVSYEYIKTFIIPLIASIIMGGITFGVYKLSIYLIDSNLLAILISIVLAVIAYFVAILLMHGLSESEMLRLPKGALLVKVAKKIHLIKSSDS